MTVPDTQDFRNQLRKTVLLNRRRQENKDELSRRIVGAFLSLPEYAVASTIMFYVDAGSEVRTRDILADVLREGDKKIVVPWCTRHGELELFHLVSMGELETGMYRIQEPRGDLRHRSEKQARIEELDLIMVPGLGFDHRGARMGHGKGYYDKLLVHAREDATFVALAFECQMLDEIPVADHDIFMDKIITEERIYGTARKQVR